MRWDDARYFLAVSRLGTLRAAARALGVDQATVGRRLAALEKRLGARLFQRGQQRYALTPAAEALLIEAEAMEQAAEAFARKAAGADSALSGTVRIAAPDILADLYLMPAAVALRQRHPDIELVLLSSLSQADPARREADLEIRTARPESGEFVVRRLASLEVGLFASEDYLARRGLPVAGAAFAGHELVMYPRDLAPHRWQALCGESILQARIALQVTSNLMMQSATLAGAGIAAMPVLWGQRLPGLVRILPERRDETQAWLVVRADLYGQARIRVVMQAIGARLGAGPPEAPG